VDEELVKRKIAVSEEEDQLRWGQKNGGEFYLKESQHYIVDKTKKTHHNYGISSRVAPSGQK
jgi:hypothetical protein